MRCPICGANGVTVTSDGQLEDLSCEKCGAGGARIAPAKATLGEYQVRYVAYARHNGREPDEQLVHDEAAWPGGRMAGFILWISKRWRQWDTKHRQGVNHVRSPVEHAAFSQWLLDTVEWAAMKCATCGHEEERPTSDTTCRWPIWDQWSVNRHNALALEAGHPESVLPDGNCAGTMTPIEEES